MSLDVYLTLKGEKADNSGSGIFVREYGQVKEISRAEWDEKYLGREPFLVEAEADNDEVYSANITHNLNTMAVEAGIYKYLWRPDEIGISQATQLINPLRQGLDLLENDSQRFEKFNPKNGWGDYDSLVGFTRSYLKACEQYPNAEVSVSR